MEITFHYPPELLELLIKTIPLLCPSKNSVLLFFQGAGVHLSDLQDMKQKIKENKESISKYEIVRTILTRVNSTGERSLRERREILKRVVEFEDFSACWLDDQLKAKGLVAEIRHVVDVKDSFTRMKQEKEEERRKHQAEHEARIESIRKEQEEINAIKKDLFSLFSMEDTNERGILLETVLNRLFKANRILVREAFKRSEEGIGIVEQIDGVIEIDGYLYLVEMKWWKDPLGKGEIAPHLVRIFNRGHAGGILISASGYTEPAILDCKEALTQKIVVLCKLQELIHLLENRGNLKDFLKSKINIAVMEKKPFARILS
jgi:restriction system protein